MNKHKYSIRVIEKTVKATSIIEGDVYVEDSDIVDIEKYDNLDYYGALDILNKYKDYRIVTKVMNDLTVYEVNLLSKKVI